MFTQDLQALRRLSAYNDTQQDLHLGTVPQLFLHSALGWCYFYNNHERIWCMIRSPSKTNGLGLRNLLWKLAICSDAMFLKSLQAPYNGFIKTPCAKNEVLWVHGVWLISRTEELQRINIYTRIWPKGASKGQKSECPGFLGQKLWPVACRRTDRQTYIYIFDV